MKPKEMIRFSIRRMAKAMIADKTPKITGTLVDAASGASCAIGGAALALGVDPEDLFGALHDIPRDGVPAVRGYAAYDKDLSETIYHHNDRTRKTKAQIGQLILDNADRKTLGTMIELPGA